MSTQARPHLVGVFPPQSKLQTPLLQTSPAAQGLLQAPQWLRSL